MSTHLILLLGQQRYLLGGRSTAGTVLTPSLRRGFQNEVTGQEKPLVNAAHAPGMLAATMFQERAIEISGGKAQESLLITISSTDLEIKRYHVN